jgi:hypothetical protein
VAIILTAPSAHACRVAPAPWNYSGHGIAVVKITNARGFGQVYDWQPWSARGRVIKTIGATVHGRYIDFKNTGQGASCDPKFDVPAPGTLWVVYLDKEPRKGWVASRQAYPLDFIIPRDARLRGSLAKRPG